jgi:hypothetical protein
MSAVPIASGAGNLSSACGPPGNAPLAISGAISGAGNGKATSRGSASTFSAGAASRGAASGGDPSGRASAKIPISACHSGGISRGWAAASSRSSRNRRSSSSRAGAISSSGGLRASSQSGSAASSAGAASGAASTVASPAGPGGSPPAAPELGGRPPVADDHDPRSRQDGLPLPVAPGPAASPLCPRRSGRARPAPPPGSATRAAAAGQRSPAQPSRLASPPGPLPVLPGPAGAPQRLAMGSPKAPLRSGLGDRSGHLRWEEAFHPRESGLPFPRPFHPGRRFGG